MVCPKPVISTRLPQHILAYLGRDAAEQFTAPFLGSLADAGKQQKHVRGKLMGRTTVLHKFGHPVPYGYKSLYPLVNEAAPPKKKAESSKYLSERSLSHLRLDG